MRRKPPGPRARSAALLLLLCAVASGSAQSREMPAGPLTRRPHYQIEASIDYDLLALAGSARVTVPAAPEDPLRDVVFFVYANAGGLGGEDERRKNIVVDGVSLDRAVLQFALEGAVLRVKLPQAQSAPFVLKIDSHGVIPRGRAGSGGLADMMGSLTADLGAMLSGQAGGAGAGRSKPKNTDYGLYSYANGMLSLGSFWYPQLAVRVKGKWVDQAPEGLGDVCYSEMSDFDVTLSAPEGVRIVAPGQAQLLPPANRRQVRRYLAGGVRDFAVLMSEDYVRDAKPFNVSGKSVTVETYTTKTNAAQSGKAIQIAGQALQIYSRRFGPYPYDAFKVVEGPIRGGAGGMEFSGLTSVASTLFQGLEGQMNELAGSLGLAGLDKLLAAAFGPAGAGDGKDAKGQGAPPASDSADGLLKGMLGHQNEMVDSLLEMTIAHEVAHQWWAIGVGSDSVRAPFVDESLANYTTMLYFEERYGRPIAEKMMNLHLKTAYSTGRMFGGDAPANLATGAYKNNMQYAGVIYGKGALYYDALRRAVGDQAFFASLREYYERYRGRLAGPRALLEIASARAPGAKVEALYRRWIEEAHGDEDIGGGQSMGIEDLLGRFLK